MNKFMERLQFKLRRRKPVIKTLLLLLSILAVSVVICGCSLEQKKNEIFFVVPQSLNDRFTAVSKQFTDSNSDFVIHVISGNDVQTQNLVKDGIADLALVYSVRESSLIDADNQLLAGKHPYVFIVNNSINIKNITDADLKKIYSGETTDWQQFGAVGQITIICPSAISPYYLAAEEKYSDYKELQNEIHADSDQDIPERISAISGSIACVDFTLIKNTNKKEFQILKYNGVECNDENCLKGTYAGMINAYLIRGKLTEEKMKFWNWLKQLPELNDIVQG